MAQKKTEKSEVKKVYVVQRPNEYGGGIIGVFADQKKAQWVKDSNHKCVIHEFEFEDDKVDTSVTKVPYYDITMKEDGTITEIRHKIFEERPNHKFYEDFAHVNGRFFGTVEDKDGEESAKKWMEDQRKEWIALAFKVEVSDQIPF